MLAGRPQQARQLDQRPGMISSRRSLFITLLPCNRWLWITISSSMSIEVKVPAVGESITSGVLSVWHKKTGDVVSEGEALFTLETDKIASEVPAVECGQTANPGRGWPGSEDWSGCGPAGRNRQASHSSCQWRSAPG